MLVRMDGPFVANVLCIFFSSAALMPLSAKPKITKIIKTEAETNIKPRDIPIS